MLIAALVLLIPIENQVSIAGFSLAKLTVIPLLVAAILLYPRRVLEAVCEPLFLAGVGFVVWAGLSESLQPFSDWEFVFRIFQMLILSILVGVLLRSREDSRRVLYSVALVSSLIAIYLVANFYDSVNQSVKGFEAASQIRSEAFSNMTFDENLNKLGWTIAMGAVIAFANLLSAQSWRPRIIWGSIYLLCAVGATVPLSRGAFLGLAGTTLLLTMRHFLKTRNVGAVVVALVVILSAVSLMPEAMTSRVTSNNESEKKEARRQLYEAALESLPIYWAFGVGAGNYSQEWGGKNGFGRRQPGGWFVTLKPHNGFLAAWIFYGLPGLGLLCLLCFYAAQRYRRSADKTAESGALFGLLILTLLWIMASHVLYNKEFGLLLGLLIGVAGWGRAKLQAGNGVMKLPSMSLR